MRRLAVGALSAVAAALSAGAAPALADSGSGQLPAATPTCPTPVLSQPFSAFEDRKLYALAPGGTFDDPSGAGWELSGGASIVSATQHDGSTGGVLDLPSKAKAVSPVVCVTADFPSARTWVRNVAGSEGVFFYVSYLVNGVWTTPKNTGQFHGKGSVWTLSDPINLQPRSTTGWQQVRFTLIAGGNTSRFQVDEFWVDPRMRT